MRFFQKLSAGDFSLGKTFWLFGILPIFLSNALSNIAINLAYLEVYILTFGATIIYMFFLIPGIWRAADKYSGKVVGAAFVAKIYAVLCVLGAAFGVFSLFLFLG